MSRESQRIANRIIDEIDRLVIVDPDVGKELVETLHSKIRQRWLPIEFSGERAALIDTAIDAACHAFGITRDLFQSRRRPERVSHARFTAWLMLESLGGFTSRQLSTKFGYPVNSINYGVRKILTLMESDEETGERVRKATLIFKGKEVGK